MSLQISNLKVFSSLSSEMNSSGNFVLFFNLREEFLIFYGHVLFKGGKSCTKIFYVFFMSDGPVL